MFSILLTMVRRLLIDVLSTMGILHNSIIAQSGNTGFHSITYVMSNACSIKSIASMSIIVLISSIKPLSVIGSFQNSMTTLSFLKY